MERRLCRQQFPDRRRWAEQDCLSERRIKPISGTVQESDWRVSTVPSLRVGIMLLTHLKEVGMAKGGREDPKARALRETRSLNPRPEEVRDEAFAGSEFLDARDLVQVKYEMVRRVEVEGWAVASAARAFGFSRPSFYAAARALTERGLPGLVPRRPGPRRAHKLSAEVLTFAREALAADPALRPGDLVGVLAERFGIAVHPRSIERALARSQEAGEGPKSG